MCVCVRVCVYGCICVSVWVGVNHMSSYTRALQLEAAHYACQSGCAVVIANGQANDPRNLVNIVDGKNVGTLITVNQDPSVVSQRSLHSTAEQGWYTVSRVPHVLHPCSCVQYIKF